MKIPGKRFPLSTLVFYVWIFTAYYAQGQTQTTVMLSPSSMIVQPSCTAALDVKVDSVVNLFAASITLMFDSTFLQYSGLAGGPFLTRNDTNSVFLGIVQQPPPPASPRAIRIDQAIAGGGTVSGSGVLFTIRFTALRAGTGAVAIVSTDLRNGSNASIPAQTISGRITVNNPPTAVELLSPPNGSTIDSTLTVTLTWSNSIDMDTGDVVKYEVHLNSARSNSCFGNLSTTSLTLTKDLLKENTEYTWHVDATDGMDTTSSAQVFTFRTPMVTGFERYRTGVPDEFNVEESYPNPFNSSATVRFTVPFETQVTVTIYDLLGRKITQLMNAQVNAGCHSLKWNGKNDNGIAAGSGTYVCMVIAGKYRVARKTILLR